MTSAETFAIIGANLAGGRAAETLRAEGFEGRIVLIGAEPERPYERPPLSKEYLRREQPRDNAFLRSAEFYDDRQIELRLGSPVIALHVAEKVIELPGWRLAYDKVLVTTGAAPRTLPVPGAQLDGVFYLRTMRDADALGDALRGQPRVLVVGAGFIGCEVAASACDLGCEVVMIDVATPLARALGEDIGKLYTEFHRNRGVDVRIGVGIAEFRGAARLEAAAFSDGSVIECDIAVIGVGVAPAVDILAGQPVTIDNGIVVDEFCKASAPDVYAAGDVANWWHPGLRERLRVEHFDNAQHQGVAAAKSMLGKIEPYAPIPFFWSDQYELNLQYIGHSTDWDEIAVRGNPHEGSFSAFYLKDGQVRACAAVNNHKDLSAARKLLISRKAISATELINATDLMEMAR